MLSAAHRRVIAALTVRANFSAEMLIAKLAAAVRNLATLKKRIWTLHLLTPRHLFTMWTIFQIGGEMIVPN